MRIGLRGSLRINEQQRRGMRVPEPTALNALLLLAAYIGGIALVVYVSGCAFHIGSDGVDAVMAGTYYGHSDEQAGNESQRWRTHAARTWGTSGIEGEITTDSELISITGDGISDNLAGVLGEDVIEAIAAAVACALQPLQPGCVGFGGDDD